MNPFEPSKTMLNNYIQNKLSETETEQLELYLVDYPDILEDLEMDIMLKQGLGELKEKESRSFFAFLDFLSHRKLIPLHLLAYGLIGFLLFNSLANKEIQTVNTIYPLNEFSIENTRSANDITTINISSKTIILKLPINEEWLNDYDEFSLVLESSKGNNKQINVLPNWDNELALSLQLQSLKDQSIVLNVFPKNTVRGNPLVQYIINIRVKN